MSSKQIHFKTDNSSICVTKWVVPNILKDRTVFVFSVKQYNKILLTQHCVISYKTGTFSNITARTSTLRMFQDPFQIKTITITCIQNLSGTVVGKNSENGKSKERSNNSPQNAMWAFSWLWDEQSIQLYSLHSVISSNSFIMTVITHV